MSRFDRAEKPPYFLHTGEENPVYQSGMDLDLELDEMHWRKAALVEPLSHGRQGGSPSAVNARAVDAGPVAAPHEAPGGTFPSSSPGPAPEEDQ